MKYRLAIFDSDGTLADTLPWMRSIFNDLAEEYGFRRVAPEEYEQFRNLHGRALLKALQLPLWKLPQVVNALRRRMADYTGKLGVFAGVSEALHCLATGGIQLAVVSSNSRQNVERVLGPDNARLIERFACGVSMFGKAARLRKVIGHCGIPHQQTIYIGDEIRDAEAAGKAGIAFGAVAWGQHDRLTLAAYHPTEFFNEVKEIVQKLC